jgi:hypothetical protein
VLRNAFAIVCWLYHVRVDCTTSAAHMRFLCCVGTIPCTHGYPPIHTDREPCRDIRRSSAGVGSRSSSVAYSLAFSSSSATVSTTASSSHTTTVSATTTCAEAAHSPG